jgi:predicted nucleotidyltransferase
MDTSTHQATIGRFTAVCRADARIVAAFLGGSYAAGRADEHSDLDLYLVVEDATYDAFFAERRTFMEQLGAPVFLEDFDGFGFDMLLFIFADGSEGELALGRASGFTQIHGGPFQPLIEKRGILAQHVFPLYQAPEAEQRATLRRAVYRFWHDLWKWSKVLARGQLWSAAGKLEELRCTCMRLARLDHDFTAPAEAYYKLDQAVTAQNLLVLQSTFCGIERDANVAAVHELIGLYLRLAPPLARRHGVDYPADLEDVVLRRVAQACGISPPIYSEIYRGPDSQS